MKTRRLEEASQSPDKWKADMEYMFLFLLYRLFMPEKYAKIGYFLESENKFLLYLEDHSVSPYTINFQVMTRQKREKSTTWLT